MVFTAHQGSGGIGAPGPSSTKCLNWWGGVGGERERQGAGQGEEAGGTGGRRRGGGEGVGEGREEAILNNRNIENNENN